MEEIIPGEEICVKCNTVMTLETKFCENCGYPQRGDAGEKAKFNAAQVLTRSKTKDAPKLLRQARNTLFFIAVVNVLSGLYFFLGQDDVASFIGALILASIYLVLGFWSQKKPLVALLLGAFLYATMLILNAVIEPSTLYSGILVKIVIVFFLVKGINAALHLKKQH